jgi:tungstate transport system ATP-binding protein
MPSSALNASRCSRLVKVACIQVDVRLGAGGPGGAARRHLRMHAASGWPWWAPTAAARARCCALLHGLLRHTAGDAPASQRRAQAMLFQRPHMLRLSALRNVRWACGCSRRALAPRPAARTAGAGAGGPGRPGQRNARALSGGQQQRLALARAWALQPDVWLLDEPTASLDPHAKREVEALMADFTQARRRPPTLVFSSHNLGQVKRLASRVVYLEGAACWPTCRCDDFSTIACCRRCPQAIFR